MSLLDHPPLLGTPAHPYSAEDSGLWGYLEARAFVSSFTNAHEMLASQHTTLVKEAIQSPLGDAANHALERAVQQHSLHCIEAQRWMRGLQPRKRARNMGR